MKRRYGSESIILKLNGVEIECTYNVEGHYYPATQETPAEYPSYNLVTAEIGGVDVMPLRDELCLDELLNETVDTIYG